MAKPLAYVIEPLEKGGGLQDPSDEAQSESDLPGVPVSKCTLTFVYHTRKKINEMLQ